MSAMAAFLEVMAAVKSLFTSTVPIILLLGSFSNRDSCFGGGGDAEEDGGVERSKSARVLLRAQVPNTGVEQLFSRT